ncbi:MAG: hypothetical protein PG981_001193 [Wolbachia endosymbiont of Ctenocephalides orientis wCori]|nr:MAG: hypothetical protein PG981_001193 [Wolbachia endosymbiont of Ctenocephalides orientis wCori]
MVTRPEDGNKMYITTLSSYRIYSSQCGASSKAGINKQESKATGDNAIKLL